MNEPVNEQEEERAGAGQPSWRPRSRVPRRKLSGAIRRRRLQTILALLAVGLVLAFPPGRHRVWTPFESAERRGWKRIIILLLVSALLVALFERAADRLTDFVRLPFDAACWICLGVGAVGFVGALLIAAQRDVHISAGVVLGIGAGAAFLRRFLSWKDE